MLKDKHLVSVILATAIFFLVNSLWIKMDNQLPIIGDDARWLEETYRMTEVVKTGDLGKVWEKWQTMFIENTNSFPRTPLFTLMSVPVFFVTGPNENVAIVVNALVLGFASILLYFLVINLFKGIKHKKEIAVVSVLLFNLFPGYFGFARLYMSEILQTFLIILTCLYIILLKDRANLKVWFGLGILLALAMLLRFIMPIYLFLPVLYFLYFQFKQNLPKRKILYLIGAFVLGFLPIFLSWYGRNLQTYWDFTKFTSSGELAEITSLGPVFSIVTIAKFWKVIALWHFGWPLLATMGMVLVWMIGKLRLSIFRILKAKNKTKKALTILFLLPIPALIVSTLSLNKTARYFLPVELFWLILFAFFITLMWHTSKRIGKVILIGAFILTTYQFVQGVSSNIPELPLTGQIFSTGQYLKVDQKELKYEYLYNFFSKELKQNTQAKIYLIPEQIQLNDAELIWYFRQKDFVLNSIGEFSSYTSIQQGEEKLLQTEYVIVDKKPVLADRYLEKYQTIVEKISDGNYIKIEENADLNIEIFVNVF